ncbi:hypothetical protein BDR04DRAFT_1149819 [Suillus decipiens]|nr:hypothetical protein BDR04DRAFT_1149819 [Suillus decipiens]
MNSIINKTDTISICGDTVFLEINGVLPVWSYYCFKLLVKAPGTKDLQTIVFHVREAPKPTCEPDSHPPNIIKMEEELVKNSDGIKFEEENMVIKKDESEDNSDKHIKMEEGEELDGVLTGPYQIQQHGTFSAHRSILGNIL